MRIMIRFTKNEIPVPFNNQEKVNYYIHKCLGKNNEYHDTMSNYCISSLQGGKMNSDKKTLSFKNGSFIVVTSEDMEFIDKLVIGINNNKTFFYGMEFDRIEFIGDLQEKKDEKYNWYNFAVLSPFIIKETIIENGKRKKKYVTLNDVDFNDKIVKSIKRKIADIYGDTKIGLKKINIPKSENNKVKKIMVKNVITYANQCQIDILCDYDLAKKIYNVGIGSSCGSGFGTVYDVINHKKYGRNY